MSMYAKFHLHPFMIAENIFDFFSFVKLSDLDKSQMKDGGLLNKHFCKKELKYPPIRQQKLSIPTFPIISLWEVKVAIATKVLVQLEQTSSPKGNDHSPESQQVIKIFCII